MEIDLDKADWGKGDGLLPAIVQDAVSGRVLMLGYVNREAVTQTLATGLVTFYSRSKQRLWQKGETSGHALRLRDMRIDCDSDTFLMLADPQGPTCHTGTQSCFGDGIAPQWAVMGDLAATIKNRRTHPEKGGYTASLFAAGLTRIAQKVGEEGVETALAAATRGPNLADEAADLLYHLLVLIEAADMDMAQVLDVLRARKK
ncbi:MAG: bifunctional phosphoribosyl-AMP cyclohydrolase/phosphoribosyl-ATP diphosphatase HisIE [Alphaproteobacteria bacterium]|nr:bifunctional phosphoribosyl-AMP cyclohydrolase/phosphoribosyl-ATP diphosphatase HisIE [Alphaproteobacteria bacterium]